MAELPQVAVPEAWKLFDEEGKRITPILVPETLPNIGRSVIYVSEDGRHLSASILHVFEDGSVELRVTDPFRPHGCFRSSPVQQDNEKHAGTWHLMEDE